MNLNFLKFIILLCIINPSIRISYAADNKKCGAAEVHLTNPEYLQADDILLAADITENWFLDKEHKNPFYILKNGDSFKTAKTLMYINIESITGTLSDAVKRASKKFKINCPTAKIQKEKALKILEAGCENITQTFTCNRQKNPYVDLVTKIKIDRKLINVVLSAETVRDIELNMTAYKALLAHIAKVK